MEYIYIISKGNEEEEGGGGMKCKMGASNSLKMRNLRIISTTLQNLLYQLLYGIGNFLILVLFASYKIDASYESFFLRLISLRLLASLRAFCICSYVTSLPFKKCQLYTVAGWYSILLLPTRSSKFLSSRDTALPRDAISSDIIVAASTLLL